MANPQKENGYTVIANEILENLNRFIIPGEAWQILGVIIRQTYGFRKKEDAIALSQFVEKTGLRRSNVCRAILKLSIANLIVIKKNANPSKITKYSINKDFESWTALSKKVKKSSLQVDNKVVSTLIIKQSPRGDIQKKLYKRNKRKGKKYKYFLQGKQIVELIDLFKPLNPMYEEFFERPTERKSLDILSKKLTFERTKNIIEQLPTLCAMPYAPKITTPWELKRNLGKMIIFYNQEMNKRSSIKKEDRELLL